jgi:hypothetical protein
MGKKPQQYTVFKERDIASAYFNYTSTSPAFHHLKFSMVRELGGRISEAVFGTKRATRILNLEAPEILITKEGTYLFRDPLSATDWAQLQEGFETDYIERIRREHSA